MRRSAVLLFALAVGLAGCTASPPAGPSVHPVEGTVIIAPRKEANATVAFHPLAPDAPPLYPAGLTQPPHPPPPGQRAPPEGPTRWFFSSTSHPTGGKLPGEPMSVPTVSPRP